MKKFTSLFALFFCLCVVGAQADNPTTVYFYSANPNSQVMYWFWFDGNNTKHESNWSTTISNNSEISSLGNNLFKIEFSNYTSPMKVIFHDEFNNETSQITLEDGKDNYYYYFGNKHYLTSDAFTIAGSFNGWQATPLSINNLSTWTFTLTSSDEIQFKFVPKRIKDDWSGVESIWLGYYESSLNNNNNPNITISAPQGWLANAGGNFVLNPSSTGYETFKITATWTPNSDFAKGWTLAIEGVGSLNLDLNDNIPFLGDGVATTAATAKYTRSNIGNGKAWGTVCLPFEIKEASDYEGKVTFYDLTGVSEDALTFTRIYSVAAGHPTVFKLADGQTKLEINEEDASVSNNTTTYSSGEWTVNGSFKAEEISNAFVIQNNEVHPSGNDLPIRAYRAWFTSSSATPAPFRIEVADTEGLEFVEQEDGTVKAYYDLQGRKLDGARKGLVIENGKIIMVK